MFWHMENLIAPLDRARRDVLTNPTKQTLLPEEFLQQCNDIQLNQDDFKQSNADFNTISDQDLINLINNNESLNDSFSKFIEKLSIEYQSDSAFFKNSISLSNIRTDSIEIRAQFLYASNKFIEKSLSLIDLSLPMRQSFLTDQFCKIKCDLLYSLKVTVGVKIRVVIIRVLTFEL
ncbi:unnamed protein product [Rotaria sp. Silwood2]|nr:unnamed protein product [Rotaria sp. Silwood2]